MPQIGWLELLIVVVIAILVIGPKDFPLVLRKLGSWTSTIKKYFSDIQSNINEITNLDETEIIKKSINNRKKNLTPGRSETLDEKKN
jgi:sec-independent protein translocase protein TatB